MVLKPNFILGLKKNISIKQRIFHMHRLIIATCVAAFRSGPHGIKQIGPHGVIVAAPPLSPRSNKLKLASNAFPF